MTELDLTKSNLTFFELDQVKEQMYELVAWVLDLNSLRGESLKGKKW